MVSFPDNIAVYVAPPEHAVVLCSVLSLMTQHKTTARSGYICCEITSPDATHYSQRSKSSLNDCVIASFQYFVYFNPGFRAFFSQIQAIQQTSTHFCARVHTCLCTRTHTAQRATLSINEYRWIFHYNVVVWPSTLTFDLVSHVDRPMVFAAIIFNVFIARAHQEMFRRQLLPSEIPNTPKITLLYSASFLYIN